MAPDELRVFQGAQHIIPVSLGPGRLALHRHEPGVKHAAVQRSEMELTNYQRHVRSAVKLETGHTALVKVVADHIAIPCCRGRRHLVDPRKPAA